MLRILTGLLFSIANTYAFCSVNAYDDLEVMFETAEELLAIDRSSLEAVPRKFVQIDPIGFFNRLAKTEFSGPRAFTMTKDFYTEHRLMLVFSVTRPRHKAMCTVFAEPQGEHWVILSIGGDINYGSNGIPEQQPSPSAQSEKTTVTTIVIGMATTDGEGVYGHSELNVGLAGETLSIMDARIVVHFQIGVLFGKGRALAGGPQFGYGRTRVESFTKGLEVAPTVHAEFGAGRNWTVTGSMDINEQGFWLGKGRIGRGVSGYWAIGPVVNYTVTSPSLHEAVDELPPDLRNWGAGIEGPIQ